MSTLSLPQQPGSTVTALRRWARSAPPWVDVLALGALALLLGLIDNTGPSVWTDEAATLSAVNRSWAQLAQLVQHIDLVHVTYYSFLHLWVGVFGLSFASMRAMSALAIGVATGAVVVVGRLTWSRTFGVVAGIVFIALPVTNYMALDARSPALSTALTTVAIAFALAATRAHGRRATAYWVAYGIVGVLAMAVFVYSVLAFVALGVALLVARVGPRRIWMTITGILIALAGGFLLVLRRESQQVSWIPAIGKATIKAVILTQFFRGDKYFLLAVALLLLIGIVEVVRRLYQRRALALDQRPAWGHPNEVGPVQLGVSWVVVPLAAILLASVVVQPVYDPHYLGFTTPGLSLLIAAALMFALRSWVTVVGVLVIIVFGVIAFRDARLPAAAFGSDWQAAANAIAKADRPGDGVAFRVNYGQDARGIKNSYPADFVGLVDPGPRVSPTADATLSGTEPPISAVHPTDGRLWLVVEQPGPKAPTVPGYHLVRNRLVGWVGITLFEVNR